MLSANELAEIFACVLLVAKSLSDANAHVHTIICRQLFTDHVLGSRPMERKEKEHYVVRDFTTTMSDSAIIQLVFVK